jgi:hypothetical protein
MVRTHLEESLALARIGVADVLLPLEEDALLDYVRLVEGYKPAQEHSLGKLLVETEHLK